MYDHFDNIPFTLTFILCFIYQNTAYDSGGGLRLLSGVG